MSGSIIIKDFKLDYVFKSHLKKLFPRTSRFLELFLPLRHPFKINSYSFKLKDIPVYFTYGGLEETDEKGKLLVAFGAYSSGLIVIDLKHISNYLSGSNVPSRERNFTSAFCKRFAQHLDSTSKYRSIIIHEYEHFIQDEFNLQLDDSDYKVARSITNFTSLDCDPLAKKLVSELSEGEKILKLLNEYVMNPNEIEARLSQWIFLLIKGHSVESIKSFERDIFGPKSHKKDSSDAFSDIYSKLTKTKTRIRDLPRLITHQKKLASYYRTRNEHEFYVEHIKLEALETELKTLKEALPVLERRSKRLHVATVYYDHMMREADQVATLFKKKYSHLIDVI